MARQAVVFGHFLVWSIKMLAKSIFLSRGAIWRDFREGVIGFRHWVNSAQGIAVICSFILVLVLASMRLLDVIRLYEPPVVPEGGEVEEQEVAVPDPVVVKLGRRQLLLSDINEFARQAGKLQAAELLSVEEVFERGLVDEAIDQLVLANAALKEPETLDDKATATRLQIARNRILAAAYLQNVINREVTEEKAFQLYQSQRENISYGDEIRLRHIVVDDETLAVETAKRIDEGAAFDVLAGDLATDGASAEKRGALGYLEYAEMPPGYAERAFKMRNGAISEPFKSSNKWVIIKVEGRRAVKPPSYDSVKEDIFEFLKLQAIEAAVASLREEAEFEVYENGSVPQENTDLENQLRD